MVGSHHSPVCFCFLAFWENSPPGKPRHFPFPLDSRVPKEQTWGSKQSWWGRFPGSCAQSRYETRPSAFRVHHAKLGQEVGMFLWDHSWAYTWARTQTHTLRKPAHSMQLPLCGCVFGKIYITWGLYDSVVSGVFTVLRDCHHHWASIHFYHPKRKTCILSHLPLSLVPGNLYSAFYFQKFAYSGHFL